MISLTGSPNKRWDEIAWAILTDESLWKALCSGSKKDWLEAYGLTLEERRILLAINADSKDGFANQLLREVDPTYEG